MRGWSPTLCLSKWPIFRASQSIKRRTDEYRNAVAERRKAQRRVKAMERAAAKGNKRKYNSGGLFGESKDADEREAAAPPPRMRNCTGCNTEQLMAHRQKKCDTCKQKTKEATKLKRKRTKNANKAD